MNPLHGVEVTCPQCQSTGWCMKPDGIRARVRHRARIRLWRKIIEVLRKGMT